MYLLTLEEEDISETCNFEKVLCDLIGNQSSTYYKDNILFYISGFIVRKIDSKIKCLECSNVLLADVSDLSAYTHFTDFISKGKLVRASHDVLKLIKYMYNLYLSNNNKEVNTYNLLAQTCRQFTGSVFKNHKFCSDFADSHEIKLIKLIGQMFFKVICHASAKEKTLAANISKLGVRQKYNKLVLFCNM